MTPKIATCCYCGTRAALTLKGYGRHELSCSSCGAPLHEMKMLRSDFSGDRDVVRASPIRRELHKVTKNRPKKKRGRKSLSKQFMDELWDVAEDIFDIFD